MTHRLLFEVGTEELPPSELPAVLDGLGDSLVRLLTEARLPFGTTQVFATPRRLTVAVSDLAGAQTSQVLTVTGPPVARAFDAAGRPTPAVEGFARTQGTRVEDLVRVTTDRGEYVAARRHEPGRPAAEVVPEILETLVTALPFSKQMRWGKGDAHFVRPVRWVVALLDKRVVPLAVAGVAAGRTTFGHRFLGPRGGIELATADAAAYVRVLRQAGVIADVAVRTQEIRARCAAVVPPGHRLREDPATLTAVVHLVEQPHAVLGAFPEEYLRLPREVVEIPIQRHQKCFPVETADGALAARFVAVSNMPDVTGDIAHGYERVIRARLADADFYFRQDSRMKPEDRVPLLAGIVFQERLGTVLEKTERLGALAAFLAGGSSDRMTVLSRAARLAKSDIASGMVREFPELQGIIGEQYALMAGEPPTVAQAIREHYLPRFADDGLPQSIEGALLSIADKIDTIVGCIGAGLMPSGSEDPYALRRQAQGLIQIALATPVPLSLSSLVDTALKLLEPKLVESADTTRARVVEFLRGRLATILTSRGLRRDIVDAVMASGFDDPVDVLRRADALAAAVSQPDWDALAVTFKRVVNILPARPIAGVAVGRFVADAERRLHAEVEARRPGIQAALARQDYRTALGALAALRPAVDDFFTAVLVMDDDERIRENRLALLRAIADLLLPIADLRKIRGA